MSWNLNIQVYAKVYAKVYAVLNQINIDPLNLFNEKGRSVARH